VNLVCIELRGGGFSKKSKKDANRPKIVSLHTIPLLKAKASCAKILKILFINFCKILFKNILKISS